MPNIQRASFSSFKVKFRASKGNSFLIGVTSEFVSLSPSKTIDFFTLRFIKNSDKSSDEYPFNAQIIS
jgi:hypothetical protein